MDTFPDEYHSKDEERYISIGTSVKNRILLIVHTERGHTKDTLLIRIIAAIERFFLSEEIMKKVKTRPAQVEDMLPEYNFTGKKRVRGKYYKAYRKGHELRIHREDGAVIVQYFTLEDEAILLESDVRKYFPSSEEVNRALRGLITLIPQKLVGQKRP